MESMNDIKNAQDLEVKAMGKRDENTAPKVKGNLLGDKLRLAAALVAGFFTIAGAGIMYISDIVVGKIEDRSRTIDILSSRETAAHELQAKIFEVYVQHVVPALDKDVDDHKKVALLAGLHGNFSEFFDTRPVFEAFAENIENTTARHELLRLAKRVARRQAEFIKAHPETTLIAGEICLCTKKSLDKFESDSVVFHLAVHDSVTIWLTTEPYRHYKPNVVTSLKEDKPALADADDELIDDLSDFVTIRLKFVEEDAKSDKEGIPMEAHTFEVSYMDTPYMDNNWMFHADGSQHQVALRLKDIDKTKEGGSIVRMEVLHFPGGIYAATERLPVKEILERGRKD